MRQVEDAVNLPRSQKLWFSEGADSGDGKDAERVRADDAVPPNPETQSLRIWAFVFGMGMGVCFLGIWKFIFLGLYVVLGGRKVRWGTMHAPVCKL